jgi:hypothetical protein
LDLEFFDGFSDLGGEPSYFVAVGGGPGWSHRSCPPSGSCAANPAAWPARTGEALGAYRRPMSFRNHLAPLIRREARSVSHGFANRIITLAIEQGYV